MVIQYRLRPIHHQPVGETERVDAVRPRGCVQPGDGRILVAALDEGAQTVEGGLLLGGGCQRHGFDAGAEIEFQSAGAARQRLRRLPPQRAAALDEAFRDEDRIGHAMAAENRSRIFGIVAIAVVQRETDEAPPLRRVGKQRRQFFQRHRRQPAFAHGADCRIEEIGRYREQPVGVMCLLDGGPHVMQGEDEAASARRRPQPPATAQRDGFQPAPDGGALEEAFYGAHAAAPSPVSAGCGASARANR